MKEFVNFLFILFIIFLISSFIWAIINMIYMKYFEKFMKHFDLQKYIKQDTSILGGTIDSEERKIFEKYMSNSLKYTILFLMILVYLVFSYYDTIPFFDLFER